MVFLRDEPRTKEQREPLTVGWGVPAAGPVRSAWEYRALHTDGAIVTAVDGEATASLVQTPIGRALQILGAEEWELVTTREAPDGTMYLFKRPGRGAA